MSPRRHITLFLFAALMLSACSNPSHAQQVSATLPPLNGEQTKPATVSRAPLPVSRNGVRQTVVGQKIEQLKTDRVKVQEFVDRFQTRLDSLKSSSEASAANYFRDLAEINSHLQAGTTPGNPVLVEKSRTAQTKLDSISQDVAQLSVLSNDITANASVAAFLLENVRATFGLTGAMDEDHVLLTSLEDDVNRLVVQIDRQLTEVNADINRRTSYLAAERRNLQTLTLAIANGELYGQSLANRAFFNPTNALPGDPDLAAMKNPASPTNTSKPLVVVRFDKPNVEFEQAVYLATSQALERFPMVNFEVVAVSPLGGNPAQSALAGSDARTNAESVRRVMTQMGIPGNRVRMSSTKSPMAHTPEVHVFLRT